MHCKGTARARSNGGGVAVGVTSWLANMPLSSSRETTLGLRLADGVSLRFCLRVRRILYTLTRWEALSDDFETTPLG